MADPKPYIVQSRLKDGVLSSWVNGVRQPDTTWKDPHGFWLCTCAHSLAEHYPPEDVGIHPAPSPCSECLCQDYERVCDA